MFAANNTPYLKVTFEDEPAPAYLRASLVSGSYFAVLGLTPALGTASHRAGRPLPAASSDDRCAAVISYRLWVRRFEQNPAAIGRTRESGTVVCDRRDRSSHVRDASDRLRAGRLASFTTAHGSKLLASRGMAFFCRRDGPPGAGCGGRAGRGRVTALYQQAQAAEPQPPAVRGQPQTRQLISRFGWRRRAGLRCDPPSVRRSARLILAVVGVVLLIASLNVANLLLARGTARLRSSPPAPRSAQGAGVSCGSSRPKVCCSPRSAGSSASASRGRRSRSWRRRFPSTT